VTSTYVLTPAEMAMLAEACRTTDELDRLETAVRQLSDLVAAGSTGQPKAHPLLEEVRRHRVLLERSQAPLPSPVKVRTSGYAPARNTPRGQLLPAGGNSTPGTPRRCPSWRCGDGCRVQWHQPNC